MTLLGVLIGVVAVLAAAATWAAGHQRALLRLWRALVRRGAPRDPTGDPATDGRRAARGVALLAAAFAVAVGAGWGGGVVIDDVIAGDGLSLVDRPVMRFFVDNRTEAATTLMRYTTRLGAAWLFVSILGAAALVAFIRSRSLRVPAIAAAAMVGGLGLTRIVKGLVDRTRPDLGPLTDAGGSSFPSGHATAAAVLFVVLAYVLARGRGWSASVWMWAIALLGAFLVAASRIYLGVHWLTDVLGGVALGGFWAAVSTRTVDRLWAR